MQEISPGLARGYSHNQRIIIYTVSSLRVTTLKSWSDDLITCLENWPQEYDSFLVIYDLSSQGVSLPFLVLTGYDIYKLGITPAGQKRVGVLLEARPHLEVRLALVVSASLSGDMAARRGRPQAPVPPQIKYQIYFDPVDALTWLEQFVPT